MALYGISFPSTRITTYALRAAYGGPGLAVGIADNALLENSPPGTVIGVLATTGTIGTPRFALLDDAGGRVALAADHVTLIAGLTNTDYEVTPFLNISVMVTGISPQLPNKLLTIDVINANEFPPVIVSNGGGPTAITGVLENTTFVTTVHATDADIGASITYSIVGGIDGSKFVINPSTGELAFASAPNYESPTDLNVDNIYNVIVQASDGVFTDTQAIDVAVLDVFEATDTTPPTITSSASINLLENVALAHPLTADEPVTWAITGGADAGLFTITGSTLNLSPKDFENRTDANFDSLYIVRVTATDLSGNSTDQIITVTVLPVNEFAPVIVSNGGGSTASIIVPENIVGRITTIVATDADLFELVTLSITGGADADKFRLGPEPGVLSFIVPPDFEAPTDADGDNNYVVIVQASDGTNTDTQTITVTVTDVSDALDTTPPVITSPATISLAENLVLSQTLTANESVTWTKSGGVDASLFTLSGTTLSLSARDFENPLDADHNNTYVVQVTATDVAGNATNQTITVTITNVNEFAPAITSNGAGPTASISIPENTIAVTTVTAVDNDAGAVLSYSIIGGADAGKFLLNSSSGVLTFITPPDFEIPTDADADNQYIVTVQVSDGLLANSQTITVTVTDVAEGSGAPSLDFSDPNNSMYIPGIL